MTTTSERLLQIAEQYDQKATALRIAAREFTDELTTQLTYAPAPAPVPTRRVRRKKSGRGGGISKVFRQGLIKDFISDGGTHTVADVMAHLWTRHHVKVARNVAWLDVKATGAVSDPRVKHGWRMPATSNGSNGHTRTAKTATKKPGVWKPMLPIVLDVLRQADAPMPIKQLSKEVRARGGGKLTGIWNYVRGGMLARTGGKKHHMYSVGPNAATTTMH